MLVRVYDKIADILQKEKQLHYTNYLKQDFVTRIEIEFRTELLKFLQIEQLLNKNYLFSIFTNYISKKTPLFDKIKDKKINKFQRISKKVDIDELKYNKIVKNRYVNTFLWYANKFLLLWSCPVDVLIQNSIIKDLTKENIWKSVCLNEFEVPIYRELVYKRTNKIFKTNDIFSDQEDNG